MFNKAFDTFEHSLSKAGISMTPLIDMVFILLIFFVVTTTFNKETGIKVKKARASTSQIINKNLLTVAIDESGQYWYDESVRPLEALVAILYDEYAQNEDLNIVIIPDKRGQVEPLITILDKLRAKNITSFSLGTQLTGTEPSR